MKRNSQTNLFVIVLILLSCGTSVCGCAQTDPHKEDLSRIGKKLEGQGVISERDLVRLRSATEKVKETGALSESELAYLLFELRSTSSEVGDPSYKHLMAAAALGLVKNYGVGQKDRIWKAALPLFESPAQNDQRAAIEIAKVHRNLEAVPLVLPLVDSPHLNVRKQAILFLEMMGYRKA